MSSLLDALTSHVDSNTIGAIAEQLGADRGQTQSAIAAALPMLVSALAKNAAQPGGAAALSNALQDHDGGILEDITGALSSPETSEDGDGILGHVLGGKRPAVEQGLSQISGLDAGSAGQLLAMLAPIVMGVLAKRANQGGLDAGGLASMLGQAASHAQQGAPQHHSILTSLLDRDGDGSIADDVGRLGMGMLGKMFDKS